MADSEKSEKSEKNEKNKIEEFLDAIGRRDWGKLSTLALVAWVGLSSALWSEREHLPLDLRVALAIWVCISVALAVWAVRTRLAKKDTGAKPNFESGAIRPLASFEERDAPLFHRLGREREINQLFQAVTSAGFRIGYLVGESGSGKSSLLKAGLVPALKEQKLQVVLVEITNADPVSSIISSLKGASTPSGTTFSQLLDDLAGRKEAPIVILDQFEQWFIHNKHAQERASFLTCLQSWYASASELRLLIGIRDDFAGRLAEVQQALGYDLSMQNNQLLRRFSAGEATDVLAAICEKEGITFDRSFVFKQLTQEVADRHDGLISPFDLQMLAFAIASTPEGRAKGFTAGSFRSAGGVEGLLYYYLRRQLDALAVGHEGTARESTAVAVLRVLSDVESTAGLGVLNEDQIAARLSPAQPDQAVRRSIQWLSSPNVRLIVPRNEGFRLVHDKVAEAIGRLVSESLVDADRANALLTRRVTEYLVNGRSPRFLLPVHEWRFLLSQKALLNWGDKEAEKRELLAASRARTYRNWALTLGTAMALGAGWVLWDDSPWVLRWRIRTEIVSLEKESHYRRLTDVVRNLMRAGCRKEAVTILQSAEEASKTELYDDDLSELLGVAIALAEVGDTEKASSLFKKAASSAAAVEDLVRRTQTTGSLASALAQAGRPDESIRTFKTALAVATGIAEDAERSKALRVVALALAKAGIGQSRADFGALAEQTAVELPVLRDRVHVLLNLAVATAKAGNRTAALALTDKAVAAVETMGAAVAAAGPLADPEKIIATAEVATALAEIGEPEKAISQFGRARELAGGLPVGDNKSPTIRVVAVSMAQCAAKTSGSLMLKQSRSLAEEQVDGSEDRSQAFREIAIAFAENGDRASALDLFRRANELIDFPQPPMPPRNASTLALLKIGMAVRMANALGQGGDKISAADLLKQTRDDAMRISDAGARAESLRIVATSLMRNGSGDESVRTLTLAAEAAGKIRDKRSRSVALSNVVTAMAQTGAMPLPSYRRSDRFRLLRQAQETASTIFWYEDQSNALRQLAVSMAVAGDLRAARKVGLQDHVPDNIPVTLSSILAGSASADDADLAIVQTGLSRDLH
jgi:tetratricopeptide (TPR) repeat protein